MASSHDATSPIVCADLKDCFRSLKNAGRKTANASRYLYSRLISGTRRSYTKFTREFRMFSKWRSFNYGRYQGIYYTIFWCGFLCNKAKKLWENWDVSGLIRRILLSLFQLNNLSNLIPSLIACELAVDSSSNWRLHVQLLEKFSCFPKCLSSDQIYYKFVPLFFRLLSSNVSFYSLLHVHWSAW